MAHYDSAAHWEWEVNLKLGYWAPEVYESFTRQVTVIRNVPVRKINQHLDYQPYLHFDFKVAAGVRELGHGWNRRGILSMPLDPAELRARRDRGKLCMPPDRTRFCVSICDDVIDWPESKTRNLQLEADAEVRGIARDGAAVRVAD